MNAPRAQGYSHNPNLGSQAQGQYGINNGSQVGSQSDQSQYGVISGSQAGLPGSQGQKGTGNGSQIGAQYDQRHQSYGESGQKNKTGGAERVGGDEDDQDQAFHPHGEEEVDSMSQRRGAAGTEKSGNSGSVSTGSTSVKVSKFPQDGEHSATMAQLHKVARKHCYSSQNLPIVRAD